MREQEEKAAQKNGKAVVPAEAGGRGRGCYD